MSRRKRKINICLIAEEAGVSASTVSRVINRRIGVGEETRRKVNTLLQQYNFTPEYPIVKSKRIAIVIPSYESKRILRAIDGMSVYADANKILMSVIPLKSLKRESLLEVIRDQQCSGIIAVVTRDHMKELLSLAQCDLPLVVIDSQFDDPRIGFIDNDSYAGAMSLTRHLIDLGHRNIGFMRYYSDSLNQLQRFKAYENTMDAAGLEIKKNWLIQAEPDPERLGAWAIGKKTMHKLFDRAPELTAVMATDDDMAIGALTAIHERGLRVPEDISITGFDNTPESCASFPALTTVDHPIVKEGTKAIEAIHQALLNPGQEELPREILPTKLVIRNSTGPVKQ